MKKQVALLLLLPVIHVFFGQEKLTHEVYFETDKYDVVSTEENRLLLFISKLDEVDIDKIEIYGFCDDRGSENYNLTLSQNRANAIKTIFSNNELDEDKISNVDGKGEILLKIVQEEDIVKIRGLNRKVEIIVHPKPKIERLAEKIKPQTDTLVKPRIDSLKTEAKSLKNIADGTVKVGDKIKLDKIYFKTGYSYLVKESKPVLKEIASILAENKDIYFTIQGHVCCTKNSRDAVDRKTNKRNLSLARAKYIYDYLAKKGIDKKRMRYVGLRRKFPLGGDPKFDRRVEILITYISPNKKS